MPISDFTITLNKSNDYVRCAVLLHIIAGTVLFRSSLPIIIAIGICPILLLTLFSILYRKKPLPQYQSLNYLGHHWIVHKTIGRPLKYQHATISFNGGIFFLVSLTGYHPKKTLLIFNDQITSKEYRWLMLIEKSVLKTK